MTGVGEADRVAATMPVPLHIRVAQGSACVSLANAGDVDRGQLQLPERALRDLQAEAAVMSRMRHPK